MPINSDVKSLMGNLQKHTKSTSSPTVRFFYFPTVKSTTKMWTSNRDSNYIRLIAITKLNQKLNEKAKIGCKALISLNHCLFIQIIAFLHLQQSNTRRRKHMQRFKLSSRQVWNCLFRIWNNKMTFLTCI